MDLVSILEADATSLYVNRLCPETLLAVLVFMNFLFYQKKKKKKKKKDYMPCVEFLYIFSVIVFLVIVVTRKQGQRNQKKEQVVTETNLRVQRLLQ